VVSGVNEWDGPDDGPGLFTLRAVMILVPNMVKINTHRLCLRVHVSSLVDVLVLRMADHVTVFNVCH